MTGPNDKTFEGMIRQIKRDIVELQRRLGQAITPPIPPAPALPASWVGYGPDSGTVADPINWEDIDAALSYTVTPVDTLEVVVSYSAHILGSGSVYGMVGAAASGGLALAPEFDQATSTLRYGITAFSSGVSGVTVMNSKTLILPAGVATTIKMQRRRSSNAFAVVVNYPMMRVVPQRWL